jgi:uncharacterized membrane-anchored protein
MAAFVACTALGRALGDLLAPSLYQAGKAIGSISGILIVALVSAALDLIALVILRAVKLPQAPHQPIQEELSHYQ